MINKHEKFNNNQITLAYPEGIENHYWNLYRNKIILSELKKEKDNLIIDIGCGRGIVVKFLLKNRIECYGVERSKLKISSNLKPYIETGIEAHNFSILDKDSFNTALLLDVLEHMENPQRFLIKITSEFKFLERIIISIPARPELWSNYDEHYGHYLRYSMERVAVDFSIAGWEFSSKKYSYKLLYLPALILAKLRIKRNIKIYAPTKKIQSLHFLIAKLIEFIDLVLPNNFLGTSIILVLKRKSSYEINIK